MLRRDLALAPVLPADVSEGFGKVPMFRPVPLSHERPGL